jgi:predicted TIM-barrel fold metal-dependent hydrolase
LTIQQFIIFYKAGRKMKKQPNSDNFGNVANGSSGLLRAPLPKIDDVEGESVPNNFPLIIDAHVHLFPDEFFASVWQWFDRFGWPIRYKMGASDVIEFLLSKGIFHIVALHYAHKPGVARMLNAYMAELCNRYPRVTGMATVFPGEKNTAGILEEGFRSGLSGVKLHAHVQCFEMESDAMQKIYEVCIKNDKPLIMHVGREPKSPAYACDPYEICSASKLERVIKTHPNLKVCVPHLGADEFDDYQRMIEVYDNLWLDTTMTLAQYLSESWSPNLSAFRSDRIMYGSDFPNLPYAWDRELRRFSRLDLPEDSLAMILGKNAAEFFTITTT